MDVFTVARELYCGLRKKFAERIKRQSNIVRTSLESNYSVCLPLFPASIFFISLPLSFLPPFSPSLYFRTTIWPLVRGLYARYARRNYRLIICWSCESRSHGNASATIKRLKERVAGSFWRPTPPTPCEIFSYRQLNRSFRKGYPFFVLFTKNFIA